MSSNQLSRLQPLTSAALQSVQLIASDMDGTLTQHERFTPQLLQALQGLSTSRIPLIVVTGRSAGWVNALVHYLPVAGAIAENGGLFYPEPSAPASFLSTIPDLPQHRRQLAQMFADLSQEFPRLQASIDNPFRLTDWTFDVAGLSLTDLQRLEQRCLAQGWGFTYSTVQCHIKPLQQDKASGLMQVLQRYYPDMDLTQIATLGDSPNDQPLFGPQFPISIGVANLRRYADQMSYLPVYTTQAAEVEGFCEVVRLLGKR